MKSKKNNSGTKTTRKNFPKTKYYFVLGIAIIIVLLLFILLVKLLFDNLKPDYYSVESRYKNAEEKNEAAQKKNANYDVVGWIRVQGTKIDFPVVAGNDDSFINPVESTAYGWLSTKGDNKYHNVMNIYGHNIMNLGKTPLLYDDSFERFEELLAFVDYDFAKENLYFQYTMNGEDHLYKIFAVDVFDSLNMSGLPTGNFTTKEFNDHVKMLRRNSIYDYDVNVTSNDDIVSLITCTGLLSDGYYYNDIVVTGKLVVNGESTKKYSVNKTSSYEDIEKEMKGDDLDE